MFIPESGEKTLAFYHHLKLHPWTAVGTDSPAPPPEVAAKLGPVHAWQYDEIVFNDPFQSFLQTLTNHPPTSLPKTKRRPVPFHSAHPASISDANSGTPEFNAQMVQEESERLENARKTVIKEVEKWREILIEKENELARLKKELDEV